ncbi:MAG: ABC transporter substrate-binding protein [Clostridiales bacterium]|nr:ABC transporter substrate-binding protein [Clostridiales bacterium]
MRKLFGILLAVLLVVTWSACFAEGETIKIGAIFPLSGSGSDNGWHAVNGASLAIEEINERGGVASLGGAKLELVTADNLSDANQCKAVAERTLEGSGVVACIGAGSSAYVVPMLPVFEKAQVPFITAQISDSITSQGYQFVFETAAKASDWAKTQLDFISWLNDTYDLGIENVGIIYENTEWGNSQAAGSVKLAESAGLNIVFNQSFPAGFSDASSLIAGLKASSAQIVIPTCYTQDAKTIVTTMDSMNYAPVIMGGGGGFLYPAFATEFGDDCIGIASTAGSNWDVAGILNREEYAGVNDKYVAQFADQFMPEHAVSAYANIYLIYNALEAAGKADPISLQAALRTISCDSCMPGNIIEFDETGLNKNATCIIVQWQKTDSGALALRTVYPESEATAEYILPEALS